MEERARKKRMDVEKERQREEKYRKRRRILKMQIGVVCVLCLVLFYVIYDKVMDSDTMGCRMAVYGTDVSWMSPEKAQKKITEEFAQTKVSFEENGKAIYETTLAQAGYSLNPDQVLQELLRLKKERRPCLSVFERRKDREINCDIGRQTEKQDEAFAASHLTGEKQQRKTAQNAKIVFNEQADRFEIAAAVPGTEIDAAKLQAKVRETIESSFEKDLLASGIKIEINKDVYKEPHVTEKQVALNKEMDTLNSRLEHYPMASVTYVFGSVKEQLDAETIQNWVVRGEDEIHLDEEKVRAYVAELAEKYDTRRADRMFKTSFGYEVGMWQSEYGYVIDQEAEYRQLCLDLESGAPVEREPVYAQVGYNRDGTDDLMGNYIEVSLDDQYMWCYKNGEVVMESPIISGKPEGINTKTGETEDWSTLRGAFEIAYMQSPSVLSSDIYGYETEVQYWMPFEDGQGFHDASWQSVFGGTVYQYAGSHGCINLSIDQAAALYRNIDEKYPVIIY